MRDKSLIGTLFSRVIILLINFIIVITTTQLWGSAGRGIIAIVIADSAIIAILNNILSGTSVGFYMPKVGFEKLMIPAYLWIVGISFLSTIFFTIFQRDTNINFLFTISLLNSLFSVNLMFFSAKLNFKSFNLYSIAMPVICLVLTYFYEFLFNMHSYKSYLWGFSTSLAIVFLHSLTIIIKTIDIKSVEISKEVIKKTLRYGVQTESSSFIHFINYRISYFLILYYNGLNSVGIYSVGIAIAESVWVISRSFSTVQYSKIINDRSIAHSLTKSYAALNLILTFAAVLTLIAIPNFWYQIIFGHDFSHVRLVTIYLFPGIISLALSNTYGHYFSAIGMAKILIIKSIIGLILTLLLSPILLPRYGLIGACITTSISYLSSSIYLIFMFYKQVKFKFSDFIPRVSEFKSLSSKSI